MMAVGTEWRFEKDYVVVDVANFSRNGYRDYTEIAPCKIYLRINDELEYVFDIKECSCSCLFREVTNE